MTPSTALVTALAAVLGAAVAELDGLERAGGRAARHAGPADGPVVEHDLDLDGRVSPGVQDLPGMHRFNGRHRRLLACSVLRVWTGRAQARPV